MTKQKDRQGTSSKIAHRVQDRNALISNFNWTLLGLNRSCAADSGNPVTEGRDDRPGKIRGRHVQKEEGCRAEGLRQAHEARERHHPEDTRAREKHGHRTHLHRSPNWENDGPRPRKADPDRSAGCGNGLLDQSVRLRLKINRAPNKASNKTPKNRNRRLPATSRK